MRTWLYNRIKAIDALPQGFKDRLISSGDADNPSAPFAIVQMGVEQPVLGMPTSAGAMTIPFTVWLHDEPGSMLSIDDGAVALKDGLPVPNGAVVGGLSLYEVKWVGTGEDAFDDHYGTNTRPVRFEMTARR